VQLAKCGLVHCDFNEFNILVNGGGLSLALQSSAFFNKPHLSCFNTFTATEATTLIAAINRQISCEYSEHGLSPSSTRSRRSR
jgi:hypothetical protein